MNGRVDAYMVRVLNGTSSWAEVRAYAATQHYKYTTKKRRLCLSYKSLSTIELTLRVDNIYRLY